MAAGPERRQAAHLAQVRRVTWTGLVVNIALAAVKFAAGIIGKSQAVLADAVHSLSDTGTDVAILVGVRYWSKPADRCHPHGHGRIELVVTSLIGAMLAFVAIGIGYNAITTIHEKPTELPGRIAFAAAIISIIAKETLYRWTVAVGKRAKSPAVIANAWHHRSDGISSIPAAFAVAAARINPSWSFVDHVGAVVVSLFILQAAWHIAAPAVGQLIDSAAPREDLEHITGIARRTDGVIHVHAVRTRHVGSGLEVDLHVLVDPCLTVREGHSIAGAVESRILDEGPDVVDVVVHVEPFEGEHPVWSQQQC